MIYRDWLNLRLHLLWCYNRPVVAAHPKVKSQILRFTEYSNSAAWLIQEGWACVEHDGEKHTAYPGQWLIVKPGPRIQSFSRDTRMLSIAFEARWPDGSHLYADGLSRVIDASSAPELEKKVKPILNAVMRIESNTWDLRDHKADLASFLNLELLLCEWLATLAKVLDNLGVNHSGHFGIDERVRQAVGILHARDFAEPLELETLAAKLNISTNHLIRLFRKELSATPNKFWDNLKVEQARHRLRQPDARIKEVAIDLGFKHLSHFSKWFKRHTGIPPQAMRDAGAR